MKNYFSKILQFILMLNCSIIFVYSQSEKTPFLIGSISTMNTLYDFSSSDSLMQQRQNKFGYLINGSLRLNLHKKLSIPLSFSIMNNQLNAYYPLPKLSFTKKLFHPSSILSFSPTFKWGTIYLGSHVPQVSKLLAGEIQIFGAGIDLNPGKFRLASSYGISEIAISPDTFNGIRGSFRQEYQTIKAGIGKKEKTGFYLNFVRFKDKINSIYAPTNLLLPKEGIGLGADLEVRISTKIKFLIDGGTTFFTDNQQSEKAESNLFPGFISLLFIPKKSSFVDFGGISSLSYNAQQFGIGLNAQYLGAGFKTPGFPNRPSDLIDLTSNIRFSLIKNKINFNGVSGIRRDNLSQTKSSTNNSLLINASLNVIPFKFLSINTSYTNFGIERREINDSINLSTISENLVISPTINFKTGQKFHIINISFTKSQSENLNLVTGNINLNNITTINILYQLKYKLFNLSLNSFNTINEQNKEELNVIGLNIIPGANLVKKKLKLGLGYSLTATNGDDIKNQRMAIVLRTSYNLGNGMNIILNGNNNYIKYRTNTTNKLFSERIIQFGISYNFGVKRKSLREKNNKHINASNEIAMDQPTNIDTTSVLSSKIRKLEILKDSSVRKVDLSKTTPDSNINTDQYIGVMSELSISEAQASKIMDKKSMSDSNDTRERDKSIYNNIQDSSVYIDHSMSKFKKDSILKIINTDIIPIPNQYNTSNSKVKLQDTIGIESKKLIDKQEIENSHLNKDAFNMSIDNKLLVESILYYVQLGATRKKQNPNLIYKELMMDVEIKYENNLNKYLVNAGNSYTNARHVLKVIKNKGYKDCFIVKYKNGNRVNINE